MLCSPPAMITSELQLNDRTTFIENHLQSSCTKDMRKKPVWSGRGSSNAERAGPTPSVVVKLGGFSAVKVPPKKRGISAPHQVPQPSVPVLRMEVPITSDSGN